MKYRTRTSYTDKQKSEMWDRWHRGESLSSIGRRFDRASSSIFPHLALTGGIRPPARARSRLALSLEEREEISRDPLSIAPARLCSIQAIELYLNALLLHSEVPQKEIRGHLHDLAGLSDKAAIYGLKLKKLTDRHLKEMTLRREYLIARYGPELASIHTERNRVTATLQEVAKKVTRHVE